MVQGFLSEEDQRVLATSAEMLIPLLQAFVNTTKADRKIHWTYFVEKYKPGKRCMETIIEIAQKNGLDIG